MTAAVYNPYWATLGGGERYTASFIRLLLDRGWQVDVWWPQDISLLIRDRFSLDISGARFTPRRPTFGYDLLFFVSDGSLPLSFAKTTLIHLQFPFSGISGHSLPNFFKSRFYKFVVNSYFTQKFIDQEFYVRSTVIYPPVDTSQFSPGPKTKTILYVGRFSHLAQAKGQSVLIDSFKHIYRRLPGWKLILAGGTAVGADPSFISALKRSARGYPIQILTDPDLSVLKKLYASATFFWSAGGFGINPESDPVKVEHFGISVVEAMSAGCVPLVTNLGGHPEIVDSGENGFLWDTPTQLEDRTLALVIDPGQLLRLSQNAVSKSKIFDIKSFNTACVSLLHV